MDSNLRGIGIALFGALVIVPDTLLMRLSGLSAAQMVAWRGLLMAAALWSVWLVLSRDRRGDLAALATPAGLGAAACQAANASLFAYGIAHAPVAVVLVAVATVPLLSGLLGAMALGDRMTPSTLAASAVVLGGIALSVSGGGGAGGQGSALFGAVAG
ncbi:EamA family transporter, partial [Palleronia rufa]